MNDRKTQWLILLDMLQEMAEKSPDDHARLRIIDLLGIVYDTMSAEEVEATYGELTN